ncbi:hypothetical protein [Nostoc sp.]
MDLSDVIAQTDVKMQRLGWTSEQRREHLRKNLWEAIAFFADR